MLLVKSHKNYFIKIKVDWKLYEEQENRIKFADVTIKILGLQKVCNTLRMKIKNAKFL